MTHSIQITKTRFSIESFKKRQSEKGFNRDCSVFFARTFIGVSAASISS